MQNVTQYGSYKTSIYVIRMGLKNIQKFVVSVSEDGAAPAELLGVGRSIHQMVLSIHKVAERLGLPRTGRFCHRDHSHLLPL